MDFYNDKLWFYCRGVPRELAPVLSFSNVAVAASAWAQDATYSGYGYRAFVALTGVTAGMYPEVVFYPAQATGGKLAPVCDAAAGGVYIYATEALSAFSIATVRVSLACRWMRSPFSFAIWAMSATTCGLLVYSAWML